MLGHLKKEIVLLLKELGLSEELGDLLESPKRSGHGHLSLPVFTLAKEYKMSPPEVAKAVSEKLRSVMRSSIERIEPLHGFVNFHFDLNFVQDVLLKSVYSNPETLGYSSVGEGKTLVIDFSSPNVAKPMHIGHLRATVIGQAIVNLAKSQGFKVIGLNHLGDWGVQFGNVAWAYQNWKKDYDFENKPFQSLYELYVRFHTEAESNPELARLGAETFKKLEAGDKEVTQIWRLVVDISLKDYSRLWGLLGVRHDLVRGESFYNDRMKPVEEELAKKGLLVESEGAMVVRLDEESIPPCLIRKADGASLYATRDLASAIYRKKELKADLNLYVVGAEQTLHFRQVFKVLEKMGHEWAQDCHHVSFGIYRFKDIGKMSSRKGNVIFLEDVLQKAIDMVRQKISQKNPDLPNKEIIARQVGVGAIIFNDLINDRVKNVDFDWDRALDFEGASGPYVQYMHVRCSSLFKKANTPVPRAMSVTLKSLEETELIRALLNFQETVKASFDNFKPHILAQYLIDVCRLFSQFYTQHRILGESEDLTEARLALVGATQMILGKGLEILNIEHPEAM